ncbi:hypothetical protein DM01DRAFT_1274772, partial [Hesseltinella vesiculosa]
LYEDPSLAERMRRYKAEKLVQEALDPRCVLFELPTKFFDRITQVYDLIEKEIGPTLGITPIQQDARKRDCVLLEVLFQKEEHTLKALRQGMKVEGLTHFASPAANEGLSIPMKMVRVNFSRTPKGSDEEILNGLKESCAVYGEVVQISKITRGGFFEGQTSVLLD